MNKYYVYGHYRADGDETPFYIGKGCGTRAWSTYKRSKFWKRTVAKHGLEVRILADNLDENTAFRMEEDFIYIHGRRDLGQGPLCNLTNGGDGPSGHIHTAETKARMSASKMGNRNARGFVHTAETRAKVSSAHKGRVHSPEHRAKNGAAQKGHTRNLGRVPTVESRAKASASHQARTIANGRLPGATLQSWGGWCARIRINGARVHLGSFATEIEASAVYLQAKTNLEGNAA